jgi:hypothetical protein
LGGIATGSMKLAEIFSEEKSFGKGKFQNK